MFRKRKEKQLKLQPDPQKLDTLATAITTQTEDEWSALEFVVTRESKGSFDIVLYNCDQEEKKRQNMINDDPILISSVIRREMYAAGMEWQKMTVTVKKESGKTFDYDTKFEY